MAAQYLRMSTEHQNYSLELQALAIAGYAEREGYTIVRTYADAGKSGLSTRGRDGLKRLLRDVIDGPSFETVLVLDVSRWGRYQDPDEAGHLEYLCRSAGVAVRYCAESFGDDGATTSVVMKAVKRAMAAEYSQQLSDRVRAGKTRSVLAGGWSGGRCPYGFARCVFEADGTRSFLLQDGQRRPRVEQSVRLVAGPKTEVATVRKIFKLLVTERMAVAEIASRLNAEGRRFRNGGAWTGQRIRKVLTNELVTGIYAVHRSDWRFGVQVRRRPSSEWIRLRMAHPIISRTLYQAAQACLRPESRAPRSDEDLLDSLRRCQTAHGAVSRALIQGDANLPHPDLFVIRFGSVRRACALAGIALTPGLYDAKNPLPPRDAAILKALDDLHLRQGHLSSALINADPYLPHANTVARRFGGLKAAYNRIGASSCLSTLSTGSRSRMGGRAGRPAWRPAVAAAQCALLAVPGGDALTEGLETRDDEAKGGLVTPSFRATTAGGRP